MRTPIILMAALGLGACMDENDVSGAMLFSQNCAACHGESAQGDGVMAEGLSAPPPDLTRLSARNDGTFPRTYVMSTIDGFTRGSHFAPDMPMFGDGDLGPTVIVENPDGTGTPIPLDLIVLADYLESIQQP